MADTDASARHPALARWLPGVAQLLAYPRGALRGDLVSGVSVCVVMIPSVLAYAELAGLRPQAGPYAALGAMLHRRALRAREPSLARATRALDR